MCTIENIIDKNLIPEDTEALDFVNTEDMIAPETASESSLGKIGPDIAQTGKYRRKMKQHQPIILMLALVLLCFSGELQGQFSGFVDIGAAYTDNAFQLSEFDLDRNEAGHPDLEFVDSADDAILSTILFGTYRMHYKWWEIRPLMQFNASQYILNTDKQRVDILAGIKLSRRLGELGIYYGYMPEYYLRNYPDNDGTGSSQRYSYEKNLYRADLKLKPFRNSTASLEYRLDQYYYNQYFTEYDGDVNTWTLGWEQSFPGFYLDGAYGFRVYETDQSAEFDTPEDASYESNIYTVGILIKKMDLDSKYPNVQWRPELNLRFENRYYQGGDDWHAGRTDNLNSTTGTLHFFFGDRWNLNLDYSYFFRNVDAMDSSVSKYKEFSENRFGINARYNF